MMTLTKRDDVFLSSFARQPSQREEGRFRFDRVPPGDYYLVMANGSRMEEMAYVNVSIDQEDVALRVQTNTGARVRGRVVVDGRAFGELDGRTGSMSVTANQPVGKYGPTVRARAPRPGAKQRRL